MERFTKKLWGTVCRGEQCDAYAIEHLQIDPSKCCSIHRHRFRHNHFVVTSGSLAVLTWPQYQGMVFENGFSLDEAYREFSIRILTGRPSLPQSFFVAAREVHQFVSLSRVEATEIYTPAFCGRLMTDDIERFSDGGEPYPGLLDKIAKMTAE